MAETDPNHVRLTGEHSCIRLHHAPDGPPRTRVSHWRILYFPGGAGHVLCIQSDVTDQAVRIDTDHIALTRWLQDEIERLLYPPFAEQRLPAIDAAFAKRGDHGSCWTERVASDDDRVALTWYDFGEPFMRTVAAGSVAGRPRGGRRSP